MVTICILCIIIKQLFNILCHLYQVLKFMYLLDQCTESSNSVSPLDSLTELAQWSSDFYLFLPEMWLLVNVRESDNYEYLASSP